MNLIQMLVPASKYGIKSPYAMTPQGIVFHNTWNDASALAEISYMIGNGNQISYHVAIDDINIVQGIPFNRNAWHAGATYANRNMIAIEGCYSRSGGSRFNKAEIESAKYIATLCKQYGWGIDRVQTHQQQNGKYCPHRTLDMGWQRFLNLVQKYITEGVEVNGWKQYSGNRWRFYVKGNFVRNEWREIEGAYYYFDKEGYILQEKWFEYRNAWYWLDKYGRMAHSGWVQILNSWYNFMESGKLREEEFYDDGTGMFYLNKGGSMAKGLKTINGKTHLFGEDGRLYRGYTIDKDGVITKN